MESSFLSFNSSGSPAQTPRSLVDFLLLWIRFVSCVCVSAPQIGPTLLCSLLLVEFVVSLIELHQH